MFDFGEALRVLKAGGKVRREGWNGRGMWVVMMPGYPNGVPANTHAAAALGVSEGATVRIKPYLAMRDVQGHLVPWLASQTDMLSEDWLVVA